MKAKLDLEGLSFFKNQFDKLSHIEKLLNRLLDTRSLQKRLKEIEKNNFCFQETFRLNEACITLHLLMHKHERKYFYLF